ncbi:MAG: sulfatase-like hydrolase/transferase [Gammaproteobacteria bacterium]|nr:MAG: sulfatase-like hydrolase/transferase [Gammaproteobacteria bacterium]
MKPTLVRLLLLLAVLIARSATAAQLPEQPNIIVVMADDHAQWAAKVYGLAQIETPNIDWLADEGVVFQNAFSPAPVCSPARASFYTGKMPSQHGVHDFLAEDPDYDADWLDGETLLSERLQSAGYRTGLFGKWHATTDSRQPQPGFDRWLSYDAYRAGWSNQYRHSGTVYFSSDGRESEYTGVQARYLTEEAIRFIDAADDRPFFISLNFVEPHAPFAGMPERLVARYRAVANDVVRAGGSSDLADRGENTLTPDDHTEQLAQYLAAVTLIDEQLGRLLDGLQGRGLLDRTIVIYTSDHGLLVGQYGLYGKTNASDPANFYEETIRIPLIVYGAEQYLRRQQSRDEFVDLLDLHTTILDYASNGKIRTTDYGPGQSLRPLLEGHRDPDWEQLQFAEHGNARMVSDGQWKLVRYYQKDGAREPQDRWYDLSHPMGERSASAAPRPALRDRLTAKLEDFFRRFETPQHTGRRIWDQPPPNARVKRELQRDAQLPGDAAGN